MSTKLFYCHSSECILLIINTQRRQIDEILLFRACVCLVQGQGRYRNFYECLRLARQFSYEYQQVSMRKNNLQTTL